MKEKLTIELFPSALDGKVKAPPSKSLSHRALICAALSRGKSTINNVMYSKDIEATINALELLGAKFDRDNDTIFVTGIKKVKHVSKAIDCSESGSTLRFLIPLFSLSNKTAIFTGATSLINRPQTIYQKIFKQDNNIFEINNNIIMVNGSVKARDYYLKGNISSQFFSGLMFALPLLKEDSTIYVEGVLESKSYIDLTISILKEFGITILELENGYFIEGNQIYKPTTYTIEGDYSQAAFHLVGGVISGLVTVSDLSPISNQGDRAIIDYLKQMKSKLIFTENGFIAELSKTYGTTIDLADCPDLGPIITLLACLSEGKSNVINISLN